MNVVLALTLGLTLIQERPLPVPGPPSLAQTSEPVPLDDLSGWFVASDPYGPLAVLHIVADGANWKARIITLPTTGATAHIWCDIAAVADGADPQTDGVRFAARGASVDAGPRWSPETSGAALHFGVSVFEREALVTDMGTGQALCGPRSELTGIYARAPD